MRFYQLPPLSIGFYQLNARAQERLQRMPETLSCSVLLSSRFALPGYLDTRRQHTEYRGA